MWEEPSRGAFGRCRGVGVVGVLWRTGLRDACCRLGGGSLPIREEGWVYAGILAVAGMEALVFSLYLSVRVGGRRSRSEDLMQQSEARLESFLLGCPFFPCTASNGPSTSCHFFGRLSFLTGFSLSHAFFLGLLDLLCSSTSSTPSLSARVSTLVLLFRSTMLAFRPACTPAVKIAAWSLCCQQKNAAAPSWSLSSPGSRTARTPSFVRRWKWSFVVGDEFMDRRQ